MFNNLNEKDKKRLLSLVSLGIVCVIALIVISCIPDGGKSSTDESTAQIIEETEIEESTSSTEESLEKKLQKILSKISGAGDVDVMITFESSEEQQPAYNSNTTTETTQEKDSQGGERTVTTESENKTMITSSSNTPIILKTNEAKVKGVIVVASGASDSKVKETLYSAVQTALQIQGHQVEIYSK